MKINTSKYLVQIYVSSETKFLPFYIRNPNSDVTLNLNDIMFVAVRTQNLFHIIFIRMVLKARELNLTSYKI
jgi:hypothetical protein